MTRTLLDLFSGKEGFSSAFKESDDWRVITVDVDATFEPDLIADVMDLKPRDLPDADVILASPPCHDFSLACVSDKWDYGLDRSPKHIPQLAQVADSIALVFRTLWLVHEFDPDWWFMENPHGMLQVFIGHPSGVVHYCQYGENRMKPTHLWGRHPPMDYRTCPGNPACGHVKAERGSNEGTQAINDSAERAKVPYDLSLAILEAIESAYANPPPEQATLPGVSET